MFCFVRQRFLALSSLVGRQESINLKSAVAIKCHISYSIRSLIIPKKEFCLARHSFFDFFEEKIKKRASRH